VMINQNQDRRAPAGTVVGNSTNGKGLRPDPGSAGRRRPYGEHSGMASGGRARRRGHWCRPAIDRRV